MIYPAVVVLAATAVVVFLVTFVIPKFAMILGGRKLPASTQFLLDVSGFLTGNALALIVGVAGCAAAVVLLMVVPETRVVVDRYKIYVPLVGPVLRLGGGGPVRHPPCPRCWKAGSPWWTPCRPRATR